LLHEHILWHIKVKLHPSRYKRGEQKGDSKGSMGIKGPWSKGKVAINTCPKENVPFQTLPNLPTKIVKIKP
jgi:hypothetical protein